MKKVSPFDVFAKMIATDNNKLGLYPINNITDMKKVKAGCKITFGCEERTMYGVYKGEIVGGFIACDKAEFHRIKTEMENES